MFNKFIFLITCLCIVVQSCDSNTNPSTTKETDTSLKKDTISAQNTANQETKMDETPVILCADVLKNKGAKDDQIIYSATMSIDSVRLLFVTRDSALSVYRQKDNNCSLVNKVPIDSCALYSYTSGSPLYLKDMDGDGRKEVLVTVEKKGGHSNYRVFKVAQENTRIVLKKIRRFEELINPQYDAATGLVRVHWSDKGNYELDEYYKISKDDTLVFVKGMELKNDKETKYTTKAGW